MCHHRPIFTRRSGAVARRSFAVRNITEILMHWQAGRPVREIARSLDVDRKTIRKYVGLARSLGYRPGQTPLAAEQWSVILHQHAGHLVDPVSRSTVFPEIARFH